jgi:hypothetical protein
MEHQIILGAITLLTLVVKAWADYRTQKGVKHEIEKNTEVSVKAFDVANGHNEKIVRTNEVAVGSMAQVLSELTEIKAELRRMKKNARSRRQRTEE